MAYVDDEEVWRCPTHPSKRRMHGVCPLCLRDKLINLCQNCANVRPCDCPHPAEPTDLKRSRSVAAVSTFLRSKSTHHNKPQVHTASNLPPTGNKSSNSFWSKLLKTKKKEISDDHHKSDSVSDRMEKKITMMMRSKSVGMGFFSNFGSFREGAGRSTTTITRSSDNMAKSSKGWFVSPAKALKKSKAAKVNNDNSPLCRG